MDDLERVDPALVPADRHAATVVLDGHQAVGRDLHGDPGGIAGHRLVDRVVDDLPDEVMQAARVGRADVHARALADRLEALEDLDAVGVVVGPPPAALARTALRSTARALFRAVLRRGLGSTRGARRGGARDEAALTCGWNCRSRGSSGQAVVEAPKILIVVVLDHDPAALPARATDTLVPSALRRSSSTRSRSGSVRRSVLSARRALARGGAGRAPRPGGPTGRCRRLRRRGGAAARPAARRGPGRGLR